MCCEIIVHTFIKTFSIYQGIPKPLSEVYKASLLHPEFISLWKAGSSAPFYSTETGIVQEKVFYNNIISAANMWLTKIHSLPYYDRKCNKNTTLIQWKPARLLISTYSVDFYWKIEIQWIAVVAAQILRNLHIL